jgi:heat shock protein HslJ
MKTKKFMLIKITIVAWVFILLNACNCDKEKLYTSWVLEQYGPEDHMVNVLVPSQVIPPGKAEIILSIGDNSSFAGNDGCNLINGTYKLNSRCKIQFTITRTTLMMCQPNTMTQAHAIKEILRNVIKYKVTDTNLVLSTENKNVLKYKKK